MKLYFQMPAAMPNGTIDISQAVSQVNRRFYRQGLNWAVQNVKLQQTATGANIMYVGTCQNSWSASNAWHKGFANWKKMQREFGLSELPSIIPKYNDFKIFLDTIHYNEWKASIDAGGTGQQVDINDANGTLVPFNHPSVSVYKPGEWIPSKFVAPTVGGATTVDYHITMHGPDVPATSVGLIEAYEKSRAVPQSPDPETGAAAPDNIYSMMFDQGTVQTDAVVQDLLDENDELPYDQDDYPGGAANAAGYEMVGFYGFTASNETGRIQQANTGPFNAQCGLIRVLQTGAQPLSIELTLVAGGHRGYLAQPMQDV